MAAYSRITSPHPGCGGAIAISCSYLDHHGKDHRPAARAGVDQLRDRVVHVLLQELDLGDPVLGELLGDPVGLVAQLFEQLLVLAEAAGDQLGRRDLAAVRERDAS